MKNKTSVEPDTEKFYDTEIAPKLLELAKACRAKGLSFLSFVGCQEWSSRTVEIPPDAPTSFTVLYEAMRQCSGGEFNVDGFMFAVAREARKTGHDSATLAALGVPTTPTKEG